MRRFRFLFLSAMIMTILFALPAEARTGSVVESHNLVVARVEYALTPVENPNAYNEVAEIQWRIYVRSAIPSRSIYGIIPVISGDSRDYFGDLDALTKDKVSDFKTVLTNYLKQYPNGENPTLSNGLPYETSKPVFYLNRKYYTCIAAYDRNIDRIGYVLVAADIPETIPAEGEGFSQAGPTPSGTPSQAEPPVQTETPVKPEPPALTENPQDTEPVVTISKAPTGVKVLAKKKKAVVSWKKIKDKNLSGKITSIHVQYATDKDFTKNVGGRKVGKEKTKATLNLKEKSTYYIRVRYVGSGGVSKWSKVKKVRTK